MRGIKAFFGEKVNGGNSEICPGENDCEKFQSQGGADRYEKEQSVCVKCPAFPTKINPSLLDIERDCQFFVNECFENRRRLKLGLFTPRLIAEAETLIVLIDELFDQYEKSSQQDFMQLALKRLGVKV